MRLSRSGPCVVVVLLLLLGTAEAGSYTFESSLDGLSRSPPNASPGTGSSTVTWDDVLHTLRVEVSFADLVGTTTAAHIHGPTAVAGAGTAGVATPLPTFPGFPLGVTGDTYDSTFDLSMASSFNPSFVTTNGGTAAGAEAALAAALADGRAYLNIHTSAFPGGEIRGFVRPTSVPLPPALPAALGLPGLLFARRRLRRG